MQKNNNKKSRKKKKTWKDKRNANKNKKNAGYDDKFLMDGTYSKQNHKFAAFYKV